MCPLCLMFQNFTLTCERIRKEPDAYRKEYLHICTTMFSQLNLSYQSKEKGDVSIEEKLLFVASMSKHYGKGREIAFKLHRFLTENLHTIKPALRVSLINAISVLAQNKDILPEAFLTLLFSILICKDKKARSAATRCIVLFLKTSKSKEVHNKISDIMKNSRDKEGVCCLRIAAELYREGIWEDSKTVSAISHACLSENQSLSVAAIGFFLRGYKKKKNTKKEEVSEEEDEEESTIAPPITFLLNQRAFVGKLIARSNAPGTIFEIKLRYLLLCGRIIGYYKLSFKEFYDCIQKHISTVHNDFSTVFLCCIEAAHEDLSDDILIPIIEKITNVFISEKAVPQKMAAAINTVREIYKRNNGALQDDTRDYIYLLRKSKEKCVSNAACSLYNAVKDKKAPVDPNESEIEEENDEEFDPIKRGIAIKATGDDSIKKVRIQRKKKDRKKKTMATRNKDYFMTMRKRVKISLGKKGRSKRLPGGKRRNGMA